MPQVKTFTVKLTLTDNGGAIETTIDGFDNFQLLGVLSYLTKEVEKKMMGNKPPRKVKVKHD